MAVRSIVMSDQPKLHKPSAAVSHIDPSYADLAKDMHDTMLDRHGVGIAAPQIGVYERVAIITQGKERKPILIINPRFLEVSEEIVEGEEGCLSIPGVFGPVERAIAVEIEYEDLTGKKHRLKARNFDARVIQHELDHLEGTLFVDHVQNPSLLHS